MNRGDSLSNPYYGAIINTNNRNVSNGNTVYPGNEHDCFYNSHIYSPVETVVLEFKNRFMMNDVSAEEMDNYQNVEGSVVKMSNKLSKKFVCLEDIKGHMVLENDVIYNPYSEDKDQSKKNINRVIQHRFGFSLTDDQLNKLTSYDCFEIDEFISDLKTIIREH